MTTLEFLFDETEEFDITSVLEQKYDHGYSPEEVENIKQEFKKLENKIQKNEEISLEEFERIVVPHIRIHRTEQFILNEKPEKVKKERIPKEKKEKVISEKKPRKKKEEMSKQEKTEKLQEISLKMANGDVISPEEVKLFQQLIKS